MSSDNSDTNRAREFLFPSNLKNIAGEVESKVTGIDEVFRSLHDQSCDLEQQVELAYQKYDDLYNDFNSEREALTQVTTEKENLAEECNLLRSSLDIAVKEKADLEDQVLGLEDALDQQANTFEEKSTILVDNCKQLEDLFDISGQEKEELQTHLNDEIHINNEFGERIMLLEKRNESVESKLEKKSDAYKNLKHVFFEDKKRGERKDQRNKNYNQELENRLNMSSERYSSSSEEVAMIVAWAVKLRKSLSDSTDLIKTDHLSVNTCQVTDEHESFKSQPSPVGSIYSSIQEKCDSPKAVPKHDIPRSLSEEYVNLTLVKEEMQKKLKSIESKGSISIGSSTQDDSTEFDSWCGEPHSLSLATNSFPTVDGI